MITAELLKKFAPKIKEPESHASALEAARAKSTVNTPRRLCHFMGQVFVETAGFTTLEENLNYRDPERLDFVFGAVKGTEDARALIKLGPQAIANRVYAGRLGNGNEASGDGWKFRGSGYKQLTGRTNFRDIGSKIHMDLESNPDIVREPVTSARVAFAYWDSRDCSTLADKGDLETITQRVNGPMKMGLAERRDATLRAMRIWA